MGTSVAKRRERGRRRQQRARRVTSQKVHILKSCTRGFVDFQSVVEILEHFGRLFVALTGACEGCRR